MMQIRFKSNWRALQHTYTTIKKLQMNKVWKKSRYSSTIWPGSREEGQRNWILLLSMATYLSMDDSCLLRRCDTIFSVLSLAFLCFLASQRKEMKCDICSCKLFKTKATQRWRVLFYLTLSKSYNNHLYVFWCVPLLLPFIYPFAD